MLTHTTETPGRALIHIFKAIPISCGSMANIQWTHLLFPPRVIDGSKEVLIERTQEALRPRGVLNEVDPSINPITIQVEVGGEDHILVLSILVDNVLEPDIVVHDLLICICQADASAWIDSLFRGSKCRGSRSLRPLSGRSTSRYVQTVGRLDCNCNTPP